MQLDTLWMALTSPNTPLSFLFQVLAAVLLLIVGWIVATWIGSMVKKLLTGLVPKGKASSSPAAMLFGSADSANSLIVVVSKAVKWLVLLFFLLSASQVAGLSLLAGMVESIFEYVPRVVSAMIIFIIGVVGAGFVEAFVKNGLLQLEVSWSRIGAKMVSYLVLVFTVLAALSELGIAQTFLTVLFVGFVATVTIALGLAFGLGAKDVVAELLRDWIARQKRQ